MGEFIGTTLLITLGVSVNCNTSLKKTYGNSSGWMVTSLGWATAVFVGVIFSAPVSGAHLNPAVTLALAVAGGFEWSAVPAYVIAQVAGACTGTLLAWLAYRKHFEEPGQAGNFLGVFATGPAIKHSVSNFLTEVIATFVFMVAVFAITKPEAGIGSIDALPVTFIVLAIGLCMGGSTGYAINPARDFGPRLMHSILPIKGKGDSNWGYAWVPVIGPLVGAFLAALLFMK